MAPPQKIITTRLARQEGLLAWDANLDVRDDEGEAEAVDGPEEDGLTQGAGNGEAHGHDAPDEAPHCDHPNAVPIVPCRALCSA
jgi:hypothetical protein